MQGSSSLERKLVEAIRSASMSCTEFCELLRRVPEGEHFWMQGTWTEYARNADLDAWRRLAAYQILIERCISYPRGLRRFITEAVLAVGIAEDRIVDMTPAHNLPFARKTGQKIRMVTLPIPTAIGPGALYFTIGEPEQSVEQGVVYPTVDFMERQHEL